MTWQAIFFDFDGVVLDTTKLKTEAFAAMYRAHGAQLEAAVVAHHRAHGGISRVHKLRYFEEELLGRSLDAQRLAALCEDFNARSHAAVLAAPFIPGARETLESVATSDMPAFIVSGTPQKELEQVVDHRQLRAYFAEVHGSPPLKPPILRDILTRYHFAPDRCLFIGDAMTDHDAAQAVGLAFLGIEPPGETHPFDAETAVSRRVWLPSPSELAALAAAPLV